ncbi:Acetyl-coenzyme A carboxylase carboxyl transferase subunit alpha [Frankliniella fusca]|uniref:Acetyl-coenzyme A carboxylase carboxyl transferase subunit alpha n=1 Tax=Frankliniella fusca TaxID=407009 RepID=A0AAE1HZC4_9NEOP|nr:Acetyl-coenzyme A carboxylase carboxyl transferase subunit alpha [Frankliniella fusca]
MADDEASEERSRSRSTIFDSEERSPSLGAESHETQPESQHGAQREAQPEALREPLELTRLSTLEHEICIKDPIGSLQNEPVILMRYQSPTGSLSWTLALRFGDPDDDDYEVSLRLLLQNVHAERPENLCVKLEARITTPSLSATAANVNVKKLFRTDGELLVSSDATQVDIWLLLPTCAGVSVNHDVLND